MPISFAIMGSMLNEYLGMISTIVRSSTYFAFIFQLLGACSIDSIPE